MFLLIYFQFAFALQDCQQQYQDCFNQDNCIIKDCEAQLFVQTTWKFQNITMKNVVFNIENHQSQVEEYSITAQIMTIQSSTFQQNIGEYFVDLAFQGLEIILQDIDFVLFEKVQFTAKTLQLQDVVMNTNFLMMYSDYVELENSLIQCHFLKCLGADCLCNQGYCNKNLIGEIKPFKRIPVNLEENFTLGIAADEVLLQNTQLFGSSIGIYANKSNITIDSKSIVYASGLGCKEQQGYGCGFYDWMLSYTLKCGSSGGSHGGFGGRPKSQVLDFDEQCKKLIPREAYGNPFNPLFEGSGGGGNYFGGYGGGVIYFQNGTIETNGESSQRDDSIIYGGGSGGSIQFRGKLFGRGLVSAEGGEGSKISGKGSGGRIFFDDPMNHNLKITTGLKSSQGTIYYNECPQGFGIIRQDSRCTQCPSGFYTYLSSVGECKRCINYDDDVNIYEQSISPICKIQSCKYGKILDKQQCVVYNFVRQSGGENVLFGIIFFIGLLVVNFIIFLCLQKRISNHKVNQTISFSDLQENPNLYEAASEDPRFLPEDLPYYVKRLYIQGNNTPSTPWHLPLHTQLDQQDINNIVSNINSIGQYTKWQQISLVFLKIWYFPFYFILLKYYQKKKSKQIFSFMQKNNRFSIYCLKLSCSSDYTLAYIDVLNYNNNILDWNKSTQFPISLVLQGDGDFLFPWQINLKDPLVKSMKMSFEKQKIFMPIDDGDSDGLLSENDEEEIHTFDEFIIKFNLLMLQIDIRKGNAEFIKNCFSLFEFIDESNSEIFNKKQILLDICFHILGFQQSSLIILTTQKLLDFQQTLRELHYIVNYKSEYQIKVSVNFEKQDFNVKRYYDNQIVINTINDINKQITMYQRYEEDKEELNNLKMQMQRKIEADGILTPLLAQKQDAEEEEDNHLQKNNKCNILWVRIIRFITITFSYFLRYRDFKNERMLTSVLVVLCIIQITLYVIYVLELIVDVFDTTYLDQQYFFTFYVVEAIVQITLFPFSQLITEIVLVIWLLNPQKKYFGKNFLIFNFCSTINNMILSIFAIIEFAIITIQNLESDYYFFASVKLILFLIQSVQGYLGTKYLTL
ncbi:unnamed protein product (macronuclear) [Paramecium tetraurelia]|uniref:Tyrosine-protein kinase ephrin type A/B receptor-like domain-containing protein n=1 Tax=Paramecium tetraurelia TaxID=5888 RepID=A0D4T2_PARTE|nr:uncharacterized protein GSPATT00013496001 [Paramecium tetraurelia]CAK78049.1 unnamed protein product [Paramecium tetraurelia]|eukprot:XP_001445446.1 hypothetical protein (macronuclear) [Paramecium tetraurelia strain d4-2]